MAQTNIGGVLLGDIILGTSQSSVISREVISTLTLTHNISNSQELVTSVLSLTQDIVLDQVFGREVTSNYVVNHTIKLVKDETVESTLTITHDIDYEKTKPRTVEQPLTFTQDIVGVYVGSRLVVHGLTWTHARDFNGVYNRTLTNNLVWGQNIVAHHIKRVDSTLNLNQEVSFDKLKHVQHSIPWQQEVLYNLVAVRPINSLFIPFQVINRTTILSVPTSNTLTLTQSIVQARVKGVSQTLNLTQIISAYAAKNVSNTLGLSQSITHQLVCNRTVGQSWAPQQTVELVQSRRFSIHHGFGVNSFVGKYRVNTRAVEQTYAPEQTIRFRTYNESVVDSYSLSQTVEYTPVYPRTINNILMFNQTIALSKVTVQNVSDVLTFLPSRQVYVGMSDVEYYEIPNVQYMLVPTYLQGKKNKPHCVLQTNNAAITLPAPEWGDNENYGGVFTIRRSMNNIPYTHVRALSLRKLQLPFILAKRKAWELREFLIANNTKLITLSTWKGDKWFVNLTSNPLELVVRGRYADEHEKVSVELEFEGLKVM